MSQHNKVNPADPTTIPKFIDPLEKPKVARPKRNLKYPLNSYYELEMKEAYHRFHRYFPLTKVWGYDGLVPGPTIEAMKDKTTYVKYINKLPKKHFLPVDTTLHTANDSPEVRTVTHLHGANVFWESDGHPESWYTQNYEYVGPKFRREVHEYTNHQPATTLWYHDHAMALTRLNVYAGLAGYYLLRDFMEERLQLPSGKYEIPMIIQDKSFNEDGSLFYPDGPQPPFPPAPVKPSITVGHLGNTITVNGKVWPYLNVEPRKYRFRMLNASNRRGYIFRLSNNQPMIQLGTDGGFLTAPNPINTIELLPAERTDLIIDFTNLAGQTITLMNDDTESAPPNEHTSVIMQFRVCVPLQGKDTSVIPTEMAPRGMDLHTEHAHIERDLPLTASVDDYGRLMLMLNDKMYHEPATEKPSLDSIEIWNFINTTPIPHPIHIHLIQGKIIGRRPFDVQKYLNEGILEMGDLELPRDYETGFKDVFKADVGYVTSVIMHWKDFTGNYIWHCHFLEHEDHDMMRPITVINDAHPVQLPHANEGHNEAAPPTDNPQNNQLANTLLAKDSELSESVEETDAETNDNKEEE
ncbi:multicopper oxidase family protein [Lysinibacillus antri]|uniref:Multicopper oxidase family protein n=1 Tax=Lysinibacillus antri TaxID=2498145 RepID=A0A3S0P6T4_9BACI|nr:multicopper oxidase [Lysinibacillus antri]RUL49891.1 multicopper oxidase family protein [Lysinibacillus antri]